MVRRDFIKFLTAAAIILPWSGKAMAMGLFGKDKNKKEKSFPFTLSDEEWRARLTPAQYHVMREEGTERAFTSELNNEKRNGSFYCAGCDQLLYSSAHKYDSGTGWPSFYQPATPDAVGTSVDHKLFYARTEIHCANCGSHLGHVFEDGPEPTGLRYCMNGVAMVFKLAES